MSATEPFALLMAEGRRVSNLGVLGMLMREEPTVRHALQSIMAYGRTHNEALFQRIEESQGIAAVHADLLLNSPGVARQAIERARQRPGQRVGGVGFDLVPQPVHQLLQQLAVAAAAVAPNMREQALPYQALRGRQ